MATKGDAALGRATMAYYKKQQAFKKAESEFKAFKKKFYAYLGGCYERGLRDDHIAFDTRLGTLALTRVQKSAVEFDAKKLSTRLPKSVAAEVISRSYTVNDMRGLVAYLKSLGADPKVFKSFIDVDMQVDVKALEQLEAIGKLDAKQLEGCYTVTEHEPYYTVRVRERSKDGEQA